MRYIKGDISLRVSFFPLQYMDTIYQAMKNKLNNAYLFVSVWPKVLGSMRDPI